MATALCNKSALVAAPKAVKASRPSRVCSVVCRAQNAEVDRRAALGMIAGAASLLAGAAPSYAAYGQAANVFGKVTNKSGFLPYAGDNFAVLIPAKWIPSKEVDFPNINVRYQDSFDDVNNFVVIVEKTDKANIEAYGSPEKFLEQYQYLLGKQAFSGETISEGGFAPNKTSAASLLDASTEKDNKGKTYYKLELLTRTADDNEGGRHQLIKATVSNGNLYLLKVQCGDKRWYRQQKKEAVGVWESFTVA